MRFLASLLRTLAFILKDSRSALAQTLPVKVAADNAPSKYVWYRRRRATYGQCAWKVKRAP